jgi:hypothetical protein
VEYEAHKICVVVSALRNSCYGCSVAPSAFGVFARKHRCSHATASRLLAVAFQWAYIGRLIDRRHEASRLPSPRGYVAGALGVLFALGPLIAGFTTNVGLIYKAVALAWSLMIYHFTGFFRNARAAA